MKPLELANRYMKILFSGKELMRLNNILAGDCKFVGPLYQFNSAQDYIDSLIENPPIDFEFEILSSYEDKNSACLVYKFTKPGISTTMVQTFEILDNKICEIKLIFDTKPFTD